ncbi:unnamed protein product [[Actinomadura] parvosata subsp. kistnae]|uniref:Uncharacterized protein n=1 Tax=[Actinomadura] parvosata subsp. kistnae TaxID=1909395 RepID=A0A1V0ABT8_9ACTN|nr:hypothetical protein [Nonomuraea sp. ATCC 55076]AQZ67639.1 hypothetical protein BKM31_44780 [Nonomuraea sp. ATCC 55076]SPL94074.1 unnamed protein product [Actinomadura parvosata subsp. kistnae]
MAATPITPAKRFFRPGITRCLWVPSIAVISAVTRLEINSGDDLSKDILDIAGWNVTGAKIDTPDLNSRYVSNIPGLISAEDSSITFYQGQDGLDVRSLMPRDEDGNIIWMDGGDVPGNLMDVYPVRVLSVGKQRNMAANAAPLVIQYAITSEPSENVVIPA